MAEVVEFVFFIILSNCNEYKNSSSFSPHIFCEKVPQKFFFDDKEICLFYGYFDDIWFLGR